MAAGGIYGDYNFILVHQELQFRINKSPCLTYNHLLFCIAYTPQG
jgi:hypothetical protein